MLNETNKRLTLPTSLYLTGHKIRTNLEHAGCVMLTLDCQNN